MALSPYVGWGLSTLALYFLNKNTSSEKESGYDPEDLNANDNQTKIGSPIPVVMGRCLIKSPLVVYFGDFHAERYTETYAAHGNFNAWPLVFALIMQVLASPVTGTTNPGQAVSGNCSHGPVTGSTSSPGTNKDNLITPLIQSLFIWLINWLINGRNLKTTIQKGFKYYLGYQYMVCWSGEDMRVRKIYLKENIVFDGDLWRAAHQVSFADVRVDNDELFGGVDEGGGFIGNLHVYLGGDGQQVDAWMQKEMQAPHIPDELKGLTPAYRDYVSIVVPTAYIGKSATIPELWIEVQNCPSRLGLGAIGDDANPAEVLFELHVNQSWGLAEKAESLDIDALYRLGVMLKNEGVGISVKLESKCTASELIDNICLHINAIKYADPRTGKMIYKLIRDDYDTASLPRVDMRILSSIEFARPNWLDTVSQISVTYTDRNACYEQSTIFADDPANVEINGGIKTTKSYNYTYFTSAGNALWAAKREQFQQGYPLASVTMVGNRHLQGMRVGEVIILDCAPYGIKNMLLRITNVEHSDFQNGSITIDAIEDVFSLAKTDFGFSGSTEWGPPEVYPSGVQAFKYMELPWELCQEKNTYVAAFAARPDVVTQMWTIWRQRLNTEFESTSSMTNWTPAGRLVYAYEEFSDVEDVIGFEIAEYEGIANLGAGSTVDFANARKGGNILVIDDEIMAYSAITFLPNGHWYVRGVLRGVCDTVPKHHIEQSPVFFIRSGYWANVTTGGQVCNQGESVMELYNITTSTVDHNELPDIAKIRQLTTVRRAERPSVPGRIRLAYHLAENKIQAKKIAGSLAVSWAARNKHYSMGCVGQDDTVDYWMNTEIAAEPGTDYVVKIGIGKFEKEYAVSGCQFVYSWEQRCLDFANFDDATRISVYARRDGLLSYQAHEREFMWIIPTLVDGISTEAEAQSRLKNWATSDRVNLPTDAQDQVLYTELPIFILGTAAAGGETNVIICSDQSSLVPDGRILIVKSATQYELYNMQPGYTFNSYYSDGLTGGEVRCSWDGQKIVKA